MEDGDVEIECVVETEVVIEGAVAIVQDATAIAGSKGSVVAVDADSSGSGSGSGVGSDVAFVVVAAAGIGIELERDAVEGYVRGGAVEKDFAVVVVEAAEPHSVATPQNQTTRTSKGDVVVAAAASH